MDTYVVTSRYPTTKVAGSIGFVSTELEREEVISAAQIIMKEDAVLFYGDDNELSHIYSLRFLVKVSKVT